MTAHVFRTVALPASCGGPIVIAERADLSSALDDAIRTGGVTPYGLVLWDVATAAVTRLLQRSVRGLRLLDVGTGVGLVALAAARAGAHVIAVDHDAGALRLVEAAAAKQQLDVRLMQADVHALEPADIDVAVFSDLLYEPALAQSVARVSMSLASAGCRVVVADPGRQGRDIFLKNTDARGTFIDDVWEVG
jgi:predicted nicotinamide N-methyase